MSTARVPTWNTLGTLCSVFSIVLGITYWFFLLIVGSGSNGALFADWDGSGFGASLESILVWCAWLAGLILAAFGTWLAGTLGVAVGFAAATLHVLTGVFAVFVSTS